MNCIACNSPLAPQSVSEAESLRKDAVDAAWSYLNRSEEIPVENPVIRGICNGILFSSIFWLALGAVIFWVM